MRELRSARGITGLLIGAGLLGSPLGMSPATAQEPVRLAGVVAAEETYTPVPSAKVTIIGTDFVAVSRENGTFEFADAPLGAQRLKVEASGFPTMVEEVDVRPGRVVFVQFILPSVDAFLDEILVVGRASEQGVGLAETRTAADLLAGKIAGVASNSGMVGLANQRVQLRGVSSISVRKEPAIFLDGVRLAGTTGEALQLLEQIPASDVEDLQILRGPVAAFLQGGSADGVIAIRTKSGRARDR